MHGFGTIKPEDLLKTIMSSGFLKWPRSNLDHFMYLYRKLESGGVNVEPACLAVDI